MEAGISALTEPGDKAIVAVGGFFGNRMAEIATRHGVRVVELRVPYGQAVPNERILAGHAPAPGRTAGGGRPRRDVDRRRPSAAGAG